MSIIAWIILGLISGFIASKSSIRRAKALFIDIVLGIVVRSWRISFSIGGFNWRNCFNSGDVRSIIGAIVFCS